MTINIAINTHHTGMSSNNPEHISLAELMELAQLIEDNPSDPTPMDNWCKEHGYNPHHLIAFFADFGEKWTKLSKEDRRNLIRKQIDAHVSEEDRKYYKDLGIELLDASEVRRRVDSGFNS